MKYEERRASECAYLCISIVVFEISQVSADDCFAALCLVNRDWLSPPRKNAINIPFFRHLRIDCFAQPVAELRSTYP